MYDSSPSRRALQHFSQVVQNKLATESKYIPYETLMTGKARSIEDDSYRYHNIEAILQSANNNYKFNDDIDNSEEEELTDDEMRDRIKERKAKEKDRRADLTTVKAAAI